MVPHDVIIIKATMAPRAILLILFIISLFELFVHTAKIVFIRQTTKQIMFFFIKILKWGSWEMGEIKEVGES